MKPKRIILIRHGQSHFNANKALRAEVPDYRIGLTELGQQQAKDAGVALGELLNGETVKIYCSPYARARETFEYIKHGASGDFNKRNPLNIDSVYEDPRIREQDFGHLRASEAFHLIDQERDAFGTFYYRIPDGESGADVYDRISNFLDTLWRDFQKKDYPENALIVSHGLTIRLFLMRWFHWSVEKFEKLRNPFNCQHFIMELGRDRKRFPAHTFGDFDTGEIRILRDSISSRYELKTPIAEYTPEDTAKWLEEKNQKPWMR